MNIVNLTLTYHKSTYSGLLLNYTSFTSRFYKIGLIKCLTDRTYKINNTGPGFHDDVSKINEVLKRNFYPLFILDKIIKAYIDRIYYNSNKVSFEVNKLHYFKACVCYFSLFLKEQCVFWLFRTKYFEKKFNISCFIFPLFPEYLFSPELPRAAHLLKNSCSEKINAFVIETMLVTLPLVQVYQARREVSQQIKHKSRQNWESS